MSAQGSRTQISYVAESTFGVTPTTPSMKRFRNTGTTLELNKDMLLSAELRGDRQISDMRHGNRRNTGDISAELSYGAYDDWLAAVFQGAWATNVLKAGVIPQSFTVERRFLDIGSSLVYTGVMPNQLTLTIQPNRLVSAVFACMGKDMGGQVATLGAPAAGASFPPFDTFTGTLTEGGAAQAAMTALTLVIDNGLEATYSLMSAATDEITVGRSTVTGRASFKFQNQTQLLKFLNETESSIEILLDGITGGDLKITLPRIKYTGAQNPVSGDGLITLEMPFQALLDATTATNIMATRIPAP